MQLHRVDVSFGNACLVSLVQTLVGAGLIFALAIIIPRWHCYVLRE